MLTYVQATDREDRYSKGVFKKCIGEVYMELAIKSELVPACIFYTSIPSRKQRSGEGWRIVEIRHQVL